MKFIPITRKYFRLFWILVIFGGFTGAAVIIHISFQAWDESPIKTTIDTLPMNDLGFPKITVCPPKNTYTNLNYDLTQADKMTFDNETRNDLLRFAMNSLQDYLHNEIMANLSKLQDKDRYYNWYHGYTEISVPYRSYAPYDEYDVYYRLHTYAKNGTIYTQYFDKIYDAKKIDGDIYYRIGLHVPTNISGNENVTLQVDIEKNSMGSDVTNFYHQDKYDHYYESGETGISANVMNIAKNYTPPGSEILFTVTRTVSKQEIIGEGEQLKKMPGFKITWDFKNGNFNSENFYYKHEDSKSDSNFKTRTSAFVRKMLYCFKLFDFLLFFSSFI